MACQRDRLVADALHQAAVADDRIGAVVDQRVAEARVHDPLGERHADRIAEALAQRTGGGLDAGRVAVFRMARGAAAELAEVLQLVERHLGVVGEVEERIEQHRAVASGEHEAVAVGPKGLARIEFQEFGEQHRRHVRHAHGHAGVAALGLLDRIHGERADRVRHLAKPGVPGRRQGRRFAFRLFGCAHL